MVFGKRGSGKTTFGVRMAEQMFGAHLPFVVLDPQGVWWGLKADKSGKGPGLGVYVFGGKHADGGIGLEPTSGALMAGVIVAERISTVFDLSEMSGRERAQWVTDFAEELFRKNTEPLHVFVEEADEFIPQRPFKGEERMLGAMEKLVKRGRSKGIGLTIITQRSASVNKNVTTQAEVLVAYRILGPQDRDAIESWIEYHGTKEDRHTVLSSLATLPTGRAWIWSPEWPEDKPLGLLQVEMRDRETFDSSATPKAGKKRREPRRLAVVDLERLRAQMAASIERAKQEDPSALRKLVSELRKKVAHLESRQPKTRSRVIVRHDLAKREIPRLLKALDTFEWQRVHMEVAGNQLSSMNEDVKSRISEFRKVIEIARSAMPLDKAAAVVDTKGIAVRAAAPAARLNRPSTTDETPVRAGSLVRSGEPRAPLNGSLSKSERAILQVLANNEEGAGINKIALLAGYTKSGSFMNSLSSLRTKRLIVGPNDAFIRITEQGLAAGEWQPLPSGEALRQYWLNNTKVLGKAERSILKEVIEAYPEKITATDIAGACGYALSGTFWNALSALRTAGLLVGSNKEPMTIAPVLAEV